MDSFKVASESIYMDIVSMPPIEVADPPFQFTAFMCSIVCVTFRQS